MRQLTKIIVISLLVSFCSATFSAQEKSSKLQILAEVATALGDLGDSIVSITDGVKHAVVTGGEGVSYLLAKKTKSDLIDLSAKSAQFAGTQNTNAIKTISEYLQNPSPTDWPLVQKQLSDVLISGSQLLTDWNEERSDFVIEPSYLQLIETLNARVSILSKLSSIDAPTTKDELAALRNVNEKYINLAENFREAITQLNEYIKNNN